MNIVFICGSLEPGKDGVGDYTKLLSGEFIRQGHEASLIAYNDRFVQKTREEIFFSRGTAIQALRLPDGLKSKHKIQLSKKWIEGINPNYLSLQYVPFAFQQKGLPFFFASQLKEISGNRKWHIMFHELWVGMNKDATFKLQFWGLIQKSIISLLIKKLHPKVVHTNTLLYRCYLQKLGVSTERLPLFSNVRPSDAFVTRNSFSALQNKKKISFLVFGSIFSRNQFADFIGECKIYAEKTGLEFSFTFVGRCGSQLQIWINHITHAGFHFQIFGEQDENKISEIIADHHFGITTTPLILIEKSGSVAALLEHGLPVLSVASTWLQKDFKKLPLLDGCYAFQTDCLNSFLKKEKLPYQPNKLSYVSKQFGESLIWF